MFFKCKCLRDRVTVSRGAAGGGARAWGGAGRARAPARAARPPQKALLAELSRYILLSSSTVAPDMLRTSVRLGTTLIIGNVGRVRARSLVPLSHEALPPTPKTRTIN